MKRFVEYYLEEKDMSHCDCKNQKVFLANDLVNPKERLQGQVENTKVKKSNQKSMVVLQITHGNSIQKYRPRMRS